ncbi:hypothetical protein V6N12_020931 [Hibiscus sabdariffa]|uniref:Polyprotein n=1 Tax=Hibiscus sabdariffa TaxID=183260 RepID=A0ABR2CZJ5_9ROSI
MALEDPNLMDALKVQIHIIGAQQVESSIIATLHYQIVYRVQDHAFRLGGCGSNDSLLITVNTQEQPHCVHIPRQIPRDELIQLLPKRWVTSYDQIHAIKQPIRSTNTKIISKGDGTSEIRRWKNGDSTVGPLGEDNGKFVFLVDYGPRKKEEIPDPDAVPQTLPRSDSSPPPSYKKKPVQPVQPCYKKIQKWIKKNPVIQKEVSHTHTPSICMFTPTGSSYNKDFPPLEEFIENEFRHIPKIPTQLHREKISAAEATLNWQTENALAQNATLQRINARVVQMDTKITMVETKVDSNTKIANELIVNLHRMLREAERRSADPGQDPFYYVEQKNQEIQRLKDYIKYLQEHGLPPSAQPGEVLFPDRSAPSSVFSPFERRTPPSLPSVFHRQPVEPKRLAPYELRELIRKQEADQKREREERERKGKSHAVHEEEEPVPKVSRSMMIRDGQQNPLSSFLKGYKEAIIPRIAAINTEETEQSSKSESSDDSQSIETQSSSDDEIQMAIPDVKTEEVEVDPMDTDASPSASAPPPFQINSGKHTFTLDDIPSTRWPQRLQEFQAWMDTQKLTRESNYEILSEFVSRFTGMLRDWWNTLSQPDQVVFLTRQSFLEVLQILHKFFLGNQDDLKTLKKKEFFKRKCCSPERRDLQKHFTIMAKLFYFLGADPNLKHTILASIPEILQNAVSRHLQSTGKRVENLTIGEIQQETYMALEEICDRKKIIKNYLTGSKEIARACRDTKLQIKCKEKEDCHCRQKMKFRSRRNDQRPFRTPAYPRSLRRKRKWRYLRKKQPQGQKSSSSSAAVASITPTPHVPVSIYLGKYSKAIDVIVFVDTGAAKTIMNPDILPAKWWTPHKKTFSTASSDEFVTHLISEPITIQFFPGCSVRTKVLGSKLPGKDLVVGFDVYTQAKFLRIIPEGLRYKQMLKPFVDISRLFIVQPTEEIKVLLEELKSKSCAESHEDFLSKCDHPLWRNSEFYVKLPFKKNEDVNPTKASHTGMNPEHQRLAEAECNELLQQGLIEPSDSQWACEAFYVNKRSEQARGKLRLVINYQPLNHFLLDDKFPLPNRNALFSSLAKAQVFSKFDLKAAPSLFQKAMVKIFQPIMDQALIYIDDILLYSPDEEAHLKLLKHFSQLIAQYGVMLSERKMRINQREIEFLGMHLKEGKYHPGPHIVQELIKFLDKDLSKKQILQFLGIVNYLRDFVPKISKYTNPLRKMLKKEPPQWSTAQSKVVKTLKDILQHLPPLQIPSDGKRILQTDASDKYWGAILFEEKDKKRHLCGYKSGRFSDAEIHYHSTFKEILAVKKAISKFEFHLIGHHFLVEMDMSSFSQMIKFKQKTVPHP